MPEPAPLPPFRLKTSLLNGSSFLKRIHDNLQSVWKLPWAPLPAVHAPIHLLDERRAPTASAAQLSSTLLHALFGATLVWLAIHPAKGDFALTVRPAHDVPRIPLLKWLQNSTAGTQGTQGISGGHDPLPPTSGELVPMSRISLLGPHLPDSRPHILTVPATVANPEAPDFVTTVNDPGLPWMNEKNNSEGQGEHGIGVGKDHGMGGDPGDGSGIGKDVGRFGVAASQVICRVCPDPIYSDEARKNKLQGSVMLSVLVGADGRAIEVRILSGIGMGLDENAIAAVRNWQFIPAKDAAHRPIASWIKVETVFRLY